ncbi:MAG: sporulation protein YqfD [Clostridia bacterium]|nr:sporulation protein YqfD [Clostridia bacterium]
MNYKIKSGLLKIECLVKCENENYFMQILHRKGVDVLSLKRVDCNNVIITVDYNKRNIFFAICKNMCYNVKKVWYKGVMSPFVNLIRYGSVVIGFILFCILSSFLGDSILQVDFTGTGKIISNQTMHLLGEYGIEKYDRFSTIDYKSLENYILENSPNLSFVSCKKSGNRLIIDSVLSKVDYPSINRNGKNLLSDVDGVISKISVLRGTAQVQVGEKVKVGDILIGGFAVGKNEEIYESFALGYAIINYEYKQEFLTENTNIEYINECKTILAFKFEDEVIGEKIELIDGGFSITLTLSHYVGG